MEEDDRMSIASGETFILNDSDLSEIFSSAEIDDTVYFERPKSPEIVTKKTRSTRSVVSSHCSQALVNQSIPALQIPASSNTQPINNNSPSFQQTNQQSIISPIQFPDDNDLDLINSDQGDDKSFSLTHDEILSLYAPTDEDCVSLYSNFNNKDLSHVNSKLPTGTMTGVHFVNRQHQSGSNKKLTNGVKSLTDHKLKVIVTKILSLLNKNDRDSVRQAAVGFQEAYVRNSILGVNAQLMNVVQRMTSMLLFFHEMKYLYRIIRYAMDLKITPIDRVLTGLIDHLGWHHEPKKIECIVKLIKEKGLPVGQVVFQCAEKYLNKQAEDNTNKHDENNNVININPNLLKRSKSPVLDLKEVEMEVDSIKHSPKHSETVENNNQTSSPLLHKCIANQSHKPSIKLAPNWKSSKTLNHNAMNIYENFKVTKHRQISMTPDLIPKATVTIANPNNSDPAALYDACILAGNDGDWATFGKMYSRMIFYLKPQYPVDDHFTNISRRIATPTTSGHMTDVYMIFDIFLNAAIENYPKFDQEITQLEKSLTRVGVDVAMRVTADVCYEILRLMQNKGLDFVPVKSKQRTSEQEEFLRSRAALVLGQACMKAHNPRLAYDVVCQYFIENKSEIMSQATGPSLNELISNLTFWLMNNGTLEEASKCASLLPVSYGTDMEKGLLCQLLRFILRQKLNNDNDLNCTILCVHAVVDQMMPRQMIRNLRRVITNAEFNVSLLIAFKYLETKGIYQGPRILQFPHLVVVPSTLYKEEIALVMYRHLQELAQFLFDTNQNIRLDLPFRVIVCCPGIARRNLGPLSANAIYIRGCNNLEYVISTTLNPSLKLVEIITMDSGEKMYNLSMLSVKHWLQINASYNDKPHSELTLQMQSRIGKPNTIIQVF